MLEWAIQVRGDKKPLIMTMTYSIKDVYTGKEYKRNELEIVRNEFTDFILKNENLLWKFYITMNCCKIAMKWFNRRDNFVTKKLFKNVRGYSRNYYAELEKIFLWIQATAINWIYSFDLRWFVLFLLFTQRDLKIPLYWDDLEVVRKWRQVEGLLHNNELLASDLYFKIKSFDDLKNFEFERFVSSL